MINDFFVYLEKDINGCNNCNSSNKTYVVFDYYDNPTGYWCKDCWYERMTEIQKKFLGVIMKYENGFFNAKAIKIGNILQSYDENDLPPSIDLKGI